MIFNKRWIQIWSVAIVLLICNVLPIAIGQADEDFAKDYRSYQQYVRSGKSFLDKGDYTSAVNSLTKAIELSPFEKNLYQQRGIARYRGEQYTKATEDFDRVLVMDNRSHGAFVYRGLCMEGTKDYVGALKDYTSALKLNPNDPAVRNNLAWLYATAADGAVRNVEKALEHGQKANELTGGNNAQVLDTLARVYFENGELEKAVETEQKALELEPENGRFKKNMETYRQGRARLEE